MDALKRAVGRGVFPHQFAWFLDLPWRRFVLSRHQLVERLALAGTEAVLEVGAGSGYYTLAIGRHARPLTVADLQPEMIGKARQRLEMARVSASYVAASATHLPFRDGAFDRIVLVTVFGEIADQPSFLREARRTLRAGGLLSISEHLPDPDFTSRRRLIARLSAEGFFLARTFGPPWAYTANFRRNAPETNLDPRRVGANGSTRRHEPG